MFVRSISSVLVILVSAAATGVGLHLIIGDDAASDVGASVMRNGVTITLQDVDETQDGTRLMFLVQGLPTHKSLGLAVDFLADQRTFKYNGDNLSDRPSVSFRPEGPHESSLAVAFEAEAGETGEFEIGRIYVLFSEGEEGGEDAFVQGPWAFRVHTPDSPYR